MVSQNAHHQSFQALLHELARAYGVLPGYRDSRGKQRESPIKSIYQVLKALGAELDEADAGQDRGAAAMKRLERALQARKQAMWARLVDPVVVFWDGIPGPLTLRLPAGTVTAVDCCLVLEGGAKLEWRVLPESLVETARERVGPREYARSRLRGRLKFGELRAGQVPYGYHRLLVEAGGLRAEAAVVSAPRRCWAPEGMQGHPWGVFVPLYALRSSRDWGVGDLTELERLRRWVTEAEGEVVATLPLLAAYLDEPFEPAPYRPVSRLFWNELYLALEDTPEWAECPAARRIWEAEGTRISSLRSARLVDYAEAMKTKRRVLEQLSRCFYDRAGSAANRAFEEYLTANPYALDYASFRARVETTRTDWRSWRDVSGDGRRRNLVDVPGRAAKMQDRSEAEKYHLYCQWRTEEQLKRVAGGEGAGLLLDVPVGVHPGGFDTWQWRDQFVEGMSIGAPPDAFFAMGQNWDMPPLHPDRVREQGHGYLSAYLRAHMRHARYIRVDHFMALHRLFCVPPGSNPADGVYITYPAEDQYAVLSLESHRNQTLVVGEDLGTVPPEVRRGMRRHEVLGTWVLQLSLQPRATATLPKPGRHHVAAVNNHDTFPFAGFLHGGDIRARVDTGQLDGNGARRELAARRRLVEQLDALLPAAGGLGSTPETRLLSRVIAHIMRARPALFLVNLEDLWGETQPQNLPGTGGERANWRRKMAATPERVKEAIEVLAAALKALG